MSIKEEIKVSVDDSEAKAGYARVKQSGESTFSSLTKSVLAANIATAALSKGIGFLKGEVSSAFAAALEYEKTNIALGKALKDNGFEIERNKAALNRQAAALQDVTGVSDDTIRSMQTMAIAMGVAPTQVDKFVSAAIRMANVTGGDAVGSMKQLIKTLSGVKGELSESVTGVSDLTTEQLRAGGAVDLVNEKFGSQLSLLTEGTGGAAVGLTNAWKDLGETMAGFSVGSSAATPIIDTITKALKGLSIAARLADVGMNALLAQFGVDGAEERGKKGMKALEDMVTGASFNDLSDTTDKPKPPPPLRDGAAKKAADAEHSDALAGAISRIRADVEAADAFKTQEAEVMESRLEREADFNEKMIELRQGQADALIAITNKQADDELDIEMRRQEKIARITGGFATIAVDALFGAIEGQDVALDQMLANFMKAQGERLLVQGAVDLFTGLSRGFGSYGFDATAYELMALGGAEIAQGTAWAGAGLAVGAVGNAARGAGGQSSAPSAAGGAGGAGGSATSGTAPARDSAPEPIVINVIGDLTDRDAQIIQNGIARSRSRGFVAA